jgi:hypothetical protein
VREVLVTSTVKDLVAGAPFVFSDRGVHELKGVGEWHLYAAGEAALGEAVGSLRSEAAR